jgi:aldehyde dehydrogenase (NAD+)
MDSINSIHTTTFLPLFEAQQVKSIELRQSTPAERIFKLSRIHQSIVEHEGALLKAMWQDFKKPEVEVMLTEVTPLYMEIKHYKKNLKKWMRPKGVRNHFPFLLGKSEIRYEPKGVVLIIAPWNYPFHMAFAPLLAAVAAGNTVIIKPSEFTTHTSKIIKQVVESVFEPNEVAVIEGDAGVAQALLTLPFNHIFFTGSTAVGKIVMRAAAEHLADVTLELGGKSPAFIDESADIAETARKLIWGKVLNAGQTCIAPDYVLINSDMQPLLVKALEGALSEMHDKSESPGLGMAAIVSKRHFERLRYLIEEAVSKGARVELGGEFDENSLRITPTVLSGVTDDMRVMQEEIFGPILPLVGIKHSKEAIDYINAHDKPLALYIFSKNPQKTNLILQQTSSGGSCVNDVVVHITNPELPFGGVNQSGIGNYHGFAGFKAFSHERSVFHQFTGFNVNKMLYPPYSPQKQKLVNWLLKFFR